MHWSCERTGFPVLELPQVQVAVHLWPVCKAQFERYLAEANGPGDAWYEQLLVVSPRLALRHADPHTYEALLLAGVQPAEAQKFAQWLGAGYNLPAVDVWRSVDRFLLAQPFTAADAAALSADVNLHRSAKLLLNVLLQHAPQTWGQLALLRGGLLEWVSSGPKTFGGLGVPRPQFYSLIMNPQRDRPVTPLRDGRYKYFGFRLVRPLK